MFEYLQEVLCSLEGYRSELDKYSFKSAFFEANNVNASIDSILNLEENENYEIYILLIITKFNNENLEHFNDIKQTFQLVYDSDGLINEQYMIAFERPLWSTLEEVMSELKSYYEESIAFKLWSIIYVNLQFIVAVKAYQGRNDFFSATSFKQIYQYTWFLLNDKESNFTEGVLSSFLEKTIQGRFGKAGSKGGKTKRDIYEPHKIKALNYHDKFFTKKKDNGKFEYSNDKTAREIIKYFEESNDPVNYSERSLSNLISKHRKENL